MMRLTDRVLDEALVQYGAWTLLIRHLCVPCADPSTVNPRVIYELAGEADRDRLVALVYAHSHDGSMLDAEELLGEVLALARDGVRPRFLCEIGEELSS